MSEITTQQKQAESGQRPGSDKSPDFVEEKTLGNSPGKSGSPSSNWIRDWWIAQKAYHRAAPKPLYRPGESLRNLKNYWLCPGIQLHLTLFLLLCAVFIAQACVYWVAVIDDSYITFRFVDMFVQGHGWRFNPDGPRVEGFTNFLWAVFLVIPHMLGMDLMFVSKIMGMASGILTMAASWGLARAVRNRDDLFNLIPPAFLATNAFFAHWGMMGLETLLQCALVTAAYWRFEAERRDPRLWMFSPILCVLAAMTRIDSLFYLSPLGLYGWWLVFFRRMTLRHLIIWGLVAAIPFSMYWVWKWSYFGDLLPNTYYAKQRHVLFEGRGRGIVQIEEFYTGQADFPKKVPAKWESIPENSANGGARKAERFMWVLTGAENTSLMWMNLWSLSAGLCLIGMLTPFLFARWRNGSGGFFSDVHTGKIFCLILLPWAMNLYYVYHVNGDWMPSYRFFQVVLPFIGVAAAVGFGYPVQIANELFGLRWKTRLIGTGSLLVVAYLTVANAYEQLSIGGVSIYGKESVYWGGRPNLWWVPDNIRMHYSKGFAPPLADVSDYLLLETQADASIFMSDIGQPLWFASHLNLYDVDGLTDPWLAHAPSRRGRIKPLEQIYEDLLRERGIKDPKPEQEEQLMDEAKRREFNLFIERNANLIMENRRPEYLLIFLNHERPDPKSRGWAYPQISGAVYGHENIKDYVDDAQIPKIGNVYNHIFRREDVKKEVPDRVKLQRLFKTIERNPRMPYLVTLLYKESEKMKDINEDQRRRVNEVVLNAIDRWSGDPIITELANLARNSGNSELAEKALVMSIRENPYNISAYWGLSRLYQGEKNFDKAIEVMWKAEEVSGGDSNVILYHLTYLNELAGDFAEARRVAEMATERKPEDSRAWSDLGALLQRAADNTDRKPEDRLDFADRSVAAFEKMMKTMNQRPDHITAQVERLNKVRAQLRKQLDIRQKAEPTPATPKKPETERTSSLRGTTEDFLRSSGALIRPESSNKTPVPPSTSVFTYVAPAETETSYDARPETSYQARGSETTYR